MIKLHHSHLGNISFGRGAGGGGLIEMQMYTPALNDTLLHTDVYSRICINSIVDPLIKNASRK